MKKREINKAADELKRSERAEKLEKKYSYRTNAERMKPFNDLFIFSSWLLQSFSALLAAGGVLLLTTKFSNNFAIISVGTIVFLLLLESFKRLSYSEFNRQRNSGEKLGKTIIIFCALAATLSVWSSYVGSEHTVNFFASEPVLINTDKIKTAYNSKIKDNNNYWKSLSEKSAMKANQIHENNNWLGVTVRAARENEQKERFRSGAYLDSLLAFESKIFSKRSEEIKKAETENEITKLDHYNWCHTFGKYMAFASICFELALFLILFWCSDFEKRDLDEISSIKGPKKKAFKDPLKSTNKNKHKDTSKVKEEALNTGNIAFAKRKVGFIQDQTPDKETFKDGTIQPPVPPAKKHRILIQLLDGRLQEYTAGTLNNLINSGISENRANHYKPYLQKLKEIENGTKK